MSTLRARLPWIGGGAGVVGALLVAWHVMYTVPARQAQDDIAAAQASIDGYERLLDGEIDLRKRGKEIGATILASKLDTLEHRFRSGLSRIGEQEGLTGVVVDDAAPVDPTNPLLSVRGIQPSLKSALRRSADFQIVRGSMKGTGTLEQVVRAVAVAQAQPWVHRVEGMSIKPVGKDREKFELRLDVATIFAPEFVSKEDTEPPRIVPLGPESEPLWRGVVAKNVFRKPSATEGPRPVEVAASGAPDPQVFAPYEDWKLTGVMNGREGAEAFFLNVKTGAKLTVPRGGQVLDAVLIDGSGEEVVVEIGGKRFVLSNGQTLAARRPQG